MTLRAPAVTRYTVPDPRRSPTEYVISALVVELRGAHEHVAIWCHGGLAGTIIMEQGDAAKLAALSGLALS